MSFELCGKTMAANCARRPLRFSPASAAKTIFNTRPTSAPRLASQKKLKFSRVPVELASAQSLIPLHSATASALFTSMLSLHSTSWGCLSEGFATPL